jgi:dipeptidyl aminopeptidase/acylaminoacyl peptidase
VINYRTGSPIRFYQLDVATGQTSDLISDPKESIHTAAYSPLGQWLAFQYAPGGDAPNGIFLAPLRNGKAGPATDWIRLMARRGTHTRPWWSPDGRAVYFLSDAGSAMDVWRQKLKTVTMQPDGEPELVFHPDPDLGGTLNYGPEFGPAVGRNFAIFPIYRQNSNVWIGDLPAR